MPKNNLQPTATRSRRFPVPLLFGLLAVCMLAILSPASSAAQTPDATIRIIELTHEAGGPMSVTFETASSDITSLELLIDGSPAEFELQSSTGTPPSVIFVVENSATMSAAQRAQLQTSASALLATTDGTTQAAIVTIGEGAQTALPFTQDHQTVSDSLATLPLIGGAALYSGVEIAAGLAAEAEGETLIVVATYGWNWGSVSTTTREASLAAIQGSGAAVYVQSLVFFGEDVAYVSALATDGTIHNLTQLPALPNAAALLTGDAVTQHTIEIDRSLLALGQHQLTLNLAGQSDSASVTDNDLLSVTATNSPEAGSPLTFNVTANDELATTSLVATVAGQTIPVAADGSIELDPWQFAPGDVAIEVSALLGDVSISTVTTEGTIPTLDPVLTTATSADAASLTASVQAQPGIVAQLLASVDGQLISTSDTATIEVTLPIEGTLSIEAVSADSTVLTSTAVTVEPSPQVTPATAPEPASEPALESPSYELVAAGLLAALALATLAIVRRRKRTRPLRMLESLPQPELAGKTTAQAVIPRAPVELRPVVGECEIVVSKHGHDEERLPLGSGTISIGASPLCDVTLEGRDIRFVHAVIGPDGPLLRIHRFGPVIMDGRPINAEDATLALGTTLIVGGTTITITRQGEQASQTPDGIVAA